MLKDYILKEQKKTIPPFFFMRMNIFVGSRKIFFFKNQIKIQNGKYKSTIKRKKEKKNSKADS